MKGESDYYVQRKQKNDQILTALSFTLRLFKLHTAMLLTVGIFLFATRTIATETFSYFPDIHM